MIKKGSKMYSVVNFKCPQCHEGDFFLANPYKLKTVGETYKNCPKCNLRYAKEPGFYFGAMYVSYAFGVALFVAIIVLYWLAFRRLDVWNLFALMGVFSVLLAPFFFHLSKIIWANIFVKYDSEAINKYQESLKK